MILRFCFACMIFAIAWTAYQGNVIVSAIFSLSCLLIYGRLLRP